MKLNELYQKPISSDKLKSSSFSEEVFSQVDFDAILAESTETRPSHAATFIYGARVMYKALESLIALVGDSDNILQEGMGIQQKSESDEEQCSA